MATVDLQVLREHVSELLSRLADPEWIVRLGDITEETPASFVLDVDSGEWFATVHVSTSGDLFYEQLSSDGGRSVACEEYSALSAEQLREHLERIVSAQRPRRQ